MLLIIVAVVTVLLASLYLLRVRHMSKLARNGIPGPKPSLILGNLIEYRMQSKVLLQEKWIKQYGKIMGFYLGQTPAVLVADADLVKNIQIKDFDKFADRPHIALKNGLHPHPASSKSLVRSTGKRWKEMRSALTPTFSSSKLKTMTPIIDDAINNFIQIIDAHSKKNEQFDIYDMFQNMTTDVIGRTAFGIQTNVQNEASNKFLEAAKAIFNMKPVQWVVLLVQAFHQVDYVLYPFRRLVEIVNHKILGLSPSGILLDMASEIVELRKKNPHIKRKDLLELMLDTKISGEEMSAMTDDQLVAGNDEVVEVKNGTHKSAPKLGKRDISLTNDEIKANCVLFYEAGYETTSTALGYMGHILVNYPDVQEKIRKEVKDLYESEGKLDFNAVSKLQYMESVFNETMRIYPPVIGFVTRECLADYHYKGITIPKGSTVIIATHHLHHDPDYWPEPEKFDPERFSPERKHEIYPSSWQPFGSGPRNCIGLRFALFEAKLCLAKLLLNYRLEAGPKTEIGKITTDAKLITMTPKNGVFVKAVKL